MRKRIFSAVMVVAIAAIAVLCIFLFRTEETIDVTRYVSCLQENLSANSEPELLYDGQHLYKLGKTAWFGSRRLRAMDVRGVSEAVPEEMTDGVAFENQILPWYNYRYIFIEREKYYNLSKCSAGKVDSLTRRKQKYYTFTNV